ncbi:unnamed protein product [Prorocentrum cordatum]|uniref:LisH domain-containing protein ARMC9 n=1 Tax=Prorocentrum cordatum TaxID=2364126 RepID=A0ABN9XSL2_9DINO|nr:unnamed protein product [Polarella glacialis]
MAAPREALGAAEGRGAQTARDQLPLKVGAALSLTAPLPNLYKATFEQASRTSKGEQWLRQRMELFDASSKQVRKKILEEFLEYVRDGAAAGLEELFSNQVHLFFVRLTAWFTVTLPVMYELPLQLKVFLTFLEFREMAFVRAFFESGAFVPLMRTLSADFDVPDEVRCLALAVLLRLAAHGREHKELMCSQGLVANVMECVEDGLRWETLKYAGRLLCELLRANPAYQGQVLDALQGFLSQELPLTQRIGAQALVSLLAGRARALPAPLGEPGRRRELVGRALALLRGGDLRVGADAYCLLCHLLRAFGCDELLFPFARAQLGAEWRRTEAWLRLETEAHAAEERGQEAPGLQCGSLLLTRLHRKVAEALDSQERALRLGGGAGEAEELGRLLQRGGEEFSEAFRAEAAHILEWGLLMYLARRNPGLCSELVEGGLTEMLLMCLLDVARPVRQAAALRELHQLRAMVPRAQRIAEEVLGRRELLQAMTFEQFAQAADPGALAQARFRLRNFHSRGRPRRDLTEEQHLQRQVLAQSHGDGHADGGQSFLTEATTEGAVSEARPQALALVCHDTPGEARGLDAKRLVHSAPFAPFCGSLASFLSDPLDLTADESSPLIQELKSVEASIDLDARLRKLAGLASPRAKASTRRAAGADLPKKPSHRDPSQAHDRAMALCTTISKRPALRVPHVLLDGALPGRAESRMTDISVHVSKNEFLGVEPGKTHAFSCGCKVCAPPSYMQLGARGIFDSLQETTFGPSNVQSQELSGEMSSEMRSWVCLPCDAGAPESPRSSAAAPEQEDLLAYLGIRRYQEGDPISEVTQRSRVTALEEVVQPGRAPASPPLSKKRILHVARPPYHDCVAFDPEAIERERLQAGSLLPREMAPGTVWRHREIQRVSGFPRKWLHGGGPHQAPAGRTPAETPSIRSSSAARPPRRAARALPPLWRPVEGPGGPAAAASARRAPEDMVDWFPASARI